MATWTVSSAAMSNPNDGVNAYPNTFQSYINQAASGDTINLPSGTFDWSPTLSSGIGVTINKSLTITGTGESTCMIRNNLSSPVNTSIMMNVLSGSDGHIRMSGIYFIQVGTLGTSVGLTQVRFGRSDTLPPGAGNQYTIIVTNCTFDGGGQFIYNAEVVSNGLIFSHCTFKGSGLGGLQITCNYATEHFNTESTMGLQQDSLVYNGVGNGYATGSGTPLNVGDTSQGYMGYAGLNNTYIEDCSLINATSGCCNGDGCARVVVRHCDCQDVIVFGHGQDSSYMGMRQYEFYNNNFYCVDGTGASRNDNDYISCRGTVNLIANNSMVAITQAGGRASIGLGCEQATLGSGPGGCQTSYPANRQCGIGWSSASSRTYGTPVVAVDGTGEASDPIFIWGNTGSGGNGTSSLWGYDTTTDNCHNGVSSAYFVQQNRDFYLDIARPGWSPYTYPHPLVNTAPQPPAAPTLSSIGPTPSFAQGNAWSFAPSSSGVTFGPCVYYNAQIAGNTNIVILWLANTGSGLDTLTGPPIDTAGNTYVLLWNTTTPLSFQWNIYVYAAYNIKAALAGANAVSATQVTSNYGEMDILEYSGLVTSSTFDIGSTAANGSGSNSASTPITTQYASDVVISGMSTNYPIQGTVTAPAGWNLEATASTNPFATLGTNFVADLQVYTPGSLNPTWNFTASNPWGGFCFALKSTLTNPPNVTSVQLVWTTSSGATSYTISYGQARGGPYPNQIPGLTSNSYTVTGLPSGTYYFVIQAINSVGSSADSNEIFAIVSTISSIEITLPRGSTIGVSGSLSARTVLRPLITSF